MVTGQELTDMQARAAKGVQSQARVDRLALALTECDGMVLLKIQLVTPCIVWVSKGTAIREVVALSNEIGLGDELRAAFMAILEKRWQEAKDQFNAV